MKNFILKTTFVAFFVSSLITASAQSTNQNNALKPVTTPLKKESPRFIAAQKPLYSTNDKTFTKAPNSKIGLRGTEVIGEGEYLNFDKIIRFYSMTGGIPIGFPKHVKGQTKKQYVEIIKTWGKNNPDKFIKLSDYMNYDESIKEMLISGTIPVDFPKYKLGQTTEQYLRTMKNWGKNNLDKVKKLYWPKNK